MTKHQLAVTADAMSLPLSERAELAQILWASIDGGLNDAEAQSSLRDAMRRDAELSDGTVRGRSHEEVMKAARGSLGCK